MKLWNNQISRSRKLLLTFRFIVQFFAIAIFLSILNETYFDIFLAARSISRRRSARTKTRRRGEEEPDPRRDLYVVSRVRMHSLTWVNGPSRATMQHCVSPRVTGRERRTRRVCSALLSADGETGPLGFLSLATSGERALLFAARPVSFFTTSDTRRPRWTSFLKTSPRTKGTSMDLSYSHFANFRCT